MEEAELVWGEIEGRGLKPNTNTFTLIIDVYAKVSLPTQRSCFRVPGAMGAALTVSWADGAQALRPERAEAAFEDMHPSQCLPDLRTFTALLSAHAKVGHSNDAEQTFDNLQRFGLKPDIHAFNALVEAYR